MLLIILLILIGFVLLIFGGNIMVDACLSFSKNTGISKALVGATLVSIITTLPEFMVSIFSTSQGATELAVGNVMGSLLFNFFIIIGVMLLFSKQINKPLEFYSKIILSLLCLLLLIIFGLDNQLTLFEGLIFIFIFICFILSQYFQAKKNNLSYNTKDTKNKYTIWKDLILAFFGAMLIIIGAKFVVDNSISLGHLLNISEHIIGITIIAIGTSLPELVTGIISICKKSITLSIGNILGTIIMNITLLMGTNSLLTSGNLYISNEVSFIITPLLFSGMLLMFLSLIIKQKFFVWQGFVLIISGLLYYLLIFL